MSLRNLDRFPYHLAALRKFSWGLKTMELVMMHPRRWKDTPRDNPIIRDYPNSLETVYMFTGLFTNTVHTVRVATLSQSLNIKKGNWL